MSSEVYPRTREGIMSINRPDKRPKKCGQCGQSYTPRSMGQKVCSIECAITYSRESRANFETKERQRKLKKDRERIKTKAQWKADAQSAFNGYIRERDKFKPCVSCGQSANQGQRHAGHYRSRGAAPERLAYNTFNCAAQCAQCNHMKSGNVIPYRAELVKRIGLWRVERLESSNKPDPITINELKRIKAVFNRRTRHLKKVRSNQPEKATGQSEESY